MNKELQLIVKGSCFFSEGCNIRINENGCLVLFSNVSFNKNAKIFVSSLLQIGPNCLFGGNNTILDGFGHQIIDNDNKNDVSSITLGESIWCAAHVTILKVVQLPLNCGLRYGSIITKSFEEKNALIVGTPAKIVKHNICWKR